MTRPGAGWSRPGAKPPSPPTQEPGGYPRSQRPLRGNPPSRDVTGETPRPVPPRATAASPLPPLPDGPLAAALSLQPGPAGTARAQRSTPRPRPSAHPAPHCRPPAPLCSPTATSTHSNALALQPLYTLTARLHIPTAPTHPHCTPHIPTTPPHPHYHPPLPHYPLTSPLHPHIPTTLPHPHYHPTSLLPPPHPHCPPPPHPHCTQKHPHCTPHIPTTPPHPHCTQTHPHYPFHPHAPGCTRSPTLLVLVLHNAVSHCTSNATPHIPICSSQSNSRQALL